MVRLLIAVLLVAVAAYIGYRLYRRSRWKTLAPLLPARFNFGKRRDTFRRALDLLEARGGRFILETGVAREGLAKSKSDGASTIVFAAWAQQHHARVVSVDIDPASISAAQAAVAQLGLGEFVEFVTSDAVAYLAQCDRAVDLLYLDSFDYDRNDPAVQQASQAHHLAEFKAIEARLHANSIVLIDDCRIRGGGKGKLVIAYMLERGWRVELSRYQMLLVRD